MSGRRSAVPTWAEIWSPAAGVEGQADWASRLDRLLIDINRTVASARDTGADELATELWPPTGAAMATSSLAGWRPTPSTFPASGARIRLLPVHGAAQGQSEFPVLRMLPRSRPVNLRHRR